jgi:ring-1,2-phenylacetyl-CoA epoxidase subunit PaaC
MAENTNKQQALFEYCLRLGDNNLVLGHRLSEWCGHGPILEEDIALINISLDLIGQSIALLTYAGQVEGKGRSEDDLAYLRDSRDFRNALLTEQPNGDFAVTLARQFFYTTHSYFLYETLKTSKDETLAGIAEKSLKEVTYHLRHCTEWILRLGDGTAESKQRIQTAVDDLWILTGDLFATKDTDALLIKEGIAPDQNNLKPKWDKMIRDVFTKASISIPSNTYMVEGSREGKHSEYLGYILAELQFMQRAYPGAKW